MKDDNDELRERCHELITQGITLADAVAKNESEKVSIYPKSQ